MDLISIKRKYKNRRNIIIVISIIIIFLVSVVIIKDNNKKRAREEMYLSYSKQYENLIKEISKKELEKKNKKLPTLTQQGIDNINNLYKTTEKRVFLTFDDGPSQKVTLPILDILKQENIKASFFVLGSRVELYPDIVKRTYEEEHYIASHGYSHIYSQIYASPQSVLDEYNKTLSAIRNAIGEQEYDPHLFRFPGGYTGGKYATIKQEAKILLEQNGVLKVDWNALTSDSAGNKTSEQFLQEVDKTVRNKNSVVLLMHDAGDKIATAEALPQIIKYFKDRGYVFENFYNIIK